MPCASSSVEIVFNSLWDSAQRRWAGASAADVAAALLPPARWMSLHACVHVVSWVSLNREMGLLGKEETEGDLALRESIPLMSITLLDLPSTLCMHTRGPNTLPRVIGMNRSGYSR